MKKIIIEIEEDLHAKFKEKVYGEGATIKEILTQFMKNYTQANYGNKKS